MKTATKHSTRIGRQKWTQAQKDQFRATMARKRANNNTQLATPVEIGQALVQGNADLRGMLDGALKQVAAQRDEIANLEHELLDMYRTIVNERKGAN